MVPDAPDPHQNANSVQTIISPPKNNIISSRWYDTLTSHLATLAGAAELIGFPLCNQAVLNQLSGVTVPTTVPNSSHFPLLVLKLFFFFFFSKVASH